MRGKIFSLIILGIFLIGIVSAATYCCEKTTSGAWCQNVNSESQCDSSHNHISALCDATSYCEPGTCINQQEGSCISSPKIICDNNGGFWSSSQKSDLSQCANGCCLIGDQAAFVTQVACTRLSVSYGLPSSFLPNINKELDCLANANPTAKGACVFTRENTRTCGFTTKKDCQDKAKDSTLTGVEFHEGYLCSAQELATNCAKTTQTICDDSGNVRFVDSCGNLANIYDSSKVNDAGYWTTIQEPTCTSTDNLGNKNSATCGSCSWISGSMCKAKKIGETVNYGGYICESLDCKDYKGFYSKSTTGLATASVYPKNGETWCATDATSGNENSPGSSSFQLTCIAGEVTKEECDSTRQKICIEQIDAVSGQTFGGCKVNQWQDCVYQNTSADCNDTSKRDCVWKQVKLTPDSQPYYITTDLGLQNYLPEDTTTNPVPDGVCVPKYAPGFARDGNDQVTGSEYCNAGNSVECTFQIKKTVLHEIFGGGWECDNSPFIKNNCSCCRTTDYPGCTGNGDQITSSLNQICTSLGDCGVKTNYIGKLGYANDNILQIIEQNSTNSTG